VSDPLNAPNVTYLWAQLLIEELVRTGVEIFFVAPGSRSTPLTVAAARHPEASVVLHVDERGTAFSALGWGRARNDPAGWITTSGTAVANGQPAVVEASVDGVPMVLLTADRPPELRDTGANQTIDQVKIFGDYVRWQADVPPPTAEIDPAYVLTTADQAVHQARRRPSGPVHLNCGFRKPLEPIEEDVSLTIPTVVENWAEHSDPFTEYPRPRSRPTDSDVNGLLRAIGETERGFVVAGRLDSEAEAKAVRDLASHLGWPLLPDLTSRLRLGEGREEARVPFFDLVLTSDAFREQHPPEAVLHLGGRVTSKRLRLFLRDSAPAVRAVVRPTPSRIDPDHRVTHHVEADVEAFAEAVRDQIDASGGYGAWTNAWTRANRRTKAVVHEHAADRLTEPALAAILTQEMPPDHVLVGASSMPVRDLERHATATDSTGLAYANRGASGIDGTVATAAGVARGHGSPATLLIGDLALWHDLNSLALLRKQPIVVVVVNNNGGGIFHFLPIRTYEDVFEPYFTTPQKRSFSSVAETFGLTYYQPESLGAFRENYAEASSASSPSLIEVRTDRAANREVHDDLEEAVAAAVTDTLAC
jgi:2-succinyl-5-enolpyruvyl-6-hydroxy-3-cyclohexene-1-carboxylate synthase